MQRLGELSWNGTSLLALAFDPTPGRSPDSCRLARLDRSILDSGPRPWKRECDWQVAFPAFKVAVRTAPQLLRTAKYSDNHHCSGGLRPPVFRRS